MKIAIITETFLPSTDGIVTRLKESIRYFHRKGHHVHIIAPDLGVYEFEGAQIDGIKAITLPFYRSKKFALPNHRVKDLLLYYNPDIVHVVNPALLGASGIYYADKLGLPMIASYHTNIAKYLEYYKLSPFKWLIWWYFRKLHNKADLNLCTSHTVKKDLEQHGIKRVQVWQRGVDTGQFNPDKYNPAMRDKLTGHKPHKRLLLFVGRLAAEKEIEKIRSVLEQSDDFVLAIVGDGPHQEALKGHFQGTNTIFTGLLHGEQLAKAYASSDVFVFPSTTETLGLVITEAMASGLPLVAAKSGPTCEQVKDNQTGLLYNSEKAGDFTETVLKFKDETLRKRLAKAAQEETAGISWDNQSDQVLSFYMTVADAYRKQLT